MPNIGDFLNIFCYLGCESLKTDIGSCWSFFLTYLKKKSCLRGKFSQFSRIFAKFAKLNPREKLSGSHFAKLNLREKKYFPFGFQNYKTYIFILGSLSINDGHVKNILQEIELSKVSLIYPNNAIWNIEKFGLEFRDSNHQKIKIYHQKINHQKQTTKKSKYIKHWQK